MSERDLVKISFIGDIMCEKPLLKASLKNGKYSFDKVFRNMKEVFHESDYVVGNLETICAGEEMGYTNHIYSFNTPEEFVEAIKKSGIDLVTTATNHCLDRGVEGLKRNLSVLNKYNLDNIGTHATPQERDELFYKDFIGVNVAFLNYTYGTNVHINKVVLNEDELFHVNLLKPQNEEIQRLRDRQSPKTIKGKIARKVLKKMSLEQWIKLKRSLGLRYNKPYQDNSLDGLDDSYLERIKSDIKKAKDNADMVVMCMHSGGQFNTKPGEFSHFMMNFMSENGVDVVVGNHPHVVQEYEKFPTGMIGLYSLGNFSMSPSSVYVLHDDLPDYSIMFHLYLDRRSKKINKMTFSILKIVENEKCCLEVFTIDKLIQKIRSEKEKHELITNATRIYNRFLKENKDVIEIKEEYLMH